MPPLAWSLQPDDAQAILTAVATTIHAGLAVPRPLTDGDRRRQRGATAGPWRHCPGLRSGNPRGRFDDAVVSGIAAVTGRLWGLTAALTDRRAHRPDRRAVHRAAARGHAARAEPVGAAGRPQRLAAAAADDRRPHGRRPVPRGHHRQPGRLLHPGDRAQPAAAGAAQRPARADPGPAGRRRSARACR